MSTTSSPNRDVESQQTVLLLLTTDASPRHRWRWIFVVLRFQRILLSSIADTQGPSDGLMINTTASEGYTSTEIPENEESLLDARPDSTNESIVSTNANLQYDNLAKMVKGNDLQSLNDFGGVQGAAVALGTDLNNGIPGSEEDVSSRRARIQLFKAQHPTQGLFKLFLKSCNSCIILLMFVSAVLSIGFGIKEKGARTGWWEGAIIFAAIIFIVLLSSIRDYKHEKANKLQWQISSERRSKFVPVIRGGEAEPKRISPDDVVCGDVVVLRKGCEIPGDGLLVSGESLKLDCGRTRIDENNPFLYHGARVIDGHGRMLVVTVGMNTSLFEKMSQGAQLAPTKTRLLALLQKASNIMQYAGLVSSILILVIVFLRFMLNMEHPHGSEVPDIRGKPISMEFIGNSIKVLLKPNGTVSFLTTSLITLVVGLAEGVPFLVTCATIWWNYKVLSNKALVQESLACVGMGSVTVVCTDLNTLLTLEVEMFCTDVEVIRESSDIHADVREALCRGIFAPFPRLQSPGSSTRDPRLSRDTLELGLELENLKRIYTTTDTTELNSWEETSRVLMETNIDNGRQSIHWSVPAETILRKCSHYYDCRGTKKSLDERKRSAFQHKIEQMRSKNLLTVAFAHKGDDSTINEDNNWVWIGLMGLKCFCSTETRNAIKAFRDAGIKVVLFSEEDESFLQARALEFGLAGDSDGLPINGKSFRTSTDKERMSMLDNNSVIGNCLIYDNLLLVKCFKEKGHVVAMVGTRAIDAPALKEANVGIAMGIHSSAFAKDSSDIIICDENFNFLATIGNYGRCVYHNIQKYILLEVTVFVVWSLLVTTTIFFLGDAPVTTIQWFWVNLLVTVPGGFALWTEPPRMELIDKPLVRPSTAPFFTKVMWRNIITQALFQVSILVTFPITSQYLKGINKKVCNTMSFNILVLFQVFNLFNAREPDMKNIFKGIRRNPWFIVAVKVILVLQFTFIEIAHMKFGNARLNLVQWGMCVLIGMLSWLTDFTAKSIWSLFDFCLASSQTGSADRTHLKPASIIELPLISSDSTVVP